MGTLKLLCKALVVVTTLSLLQSCKSGSEVKPFPSEYIYESFPGKQGCIQYPIIENNQVGRGKLLSTENCPKSVFGVANSEVGAVMNWIDDMRIAFEEKCN